MRELGRVGVNAESVSAFKQEISYLAKLLGEEKRSGRVQLQIGHLYGLVEIVEKLLDYQELKTDAKRDELERYARTYGGGVHTLIWPVIHPPNQGCTEQMQSSEQNQGIPQQN
jgi:hypothetical protein